MRDHPEETAIALEARAKHKHPILLLGMLVVLAASQLAGCATATRARLAVTPVVSTSFSFVDQRVPTAEAGAKVIRIADTDIQPSPVELVRATLQDRLGPQLVGRSVVLQSFDITVQTLERNADPAYCNPAYCGPGGLLLMSAMTPNLRIATVKFALTVDGKQIEGRGGSSKEGGFSEEELAAAIRSGLESMVRDVKAALQ